MARSPYRKRGKQIWHSVFFFLGLSSRQPNCFIYLSSYEAIRRELLLYNDILRDEGQYLYFADV